MSRSQYNWLQMSAEQPRAAARMILAAAEAGEVRAQLYLGQILLDGHGIERDAALALQWFRLAAAGGEVEALNMVGRCLHNGWGCQVDLPGAVACFRHAAERGLDWGQYNYANMLAKGWGIECDMPAALDWYRQAAAQGHAKALNLVGRFYEEGWVVKADLAVAFDCYRASAQAGDFRGQCSYASMLVARGEIDDAARWLRLATDTATVPFLQKMIEVLQSSIHQPLREVAEAMQARLQAV